MNKFIGGTKINKKYIGGTEIKKSYLGGNIWTSVPIAGNYAIFDAPSYLDLGIPVQLQISDDIKVEAKIKDTFTQYKSLGSRYTSGSEQSWLMYTSFTTLIVQISSDGGNSNIKNYTSNVPVADGDKVGFTFKNNDTGDDLKLFINDVQVAVSKVIDNTVTSLHNPASIPVLVGTDHAMNIYSFKMYDTGTLVFDFDPETYGDLLDHSSYTESITNNGVTLG